MTRHAPRPTTRPGRGAVPPGARSRPGPRGRCGARGRRGFTLIEILVAMMIFLTGMTGLLALMTTGLALHRDGLVLSRGTAELDRIADRVEREVAAGGHWDAAREAWVDVSAERLPDGTWYAVHFRTPGLDEPQVVELRVAGSAKGLETADPVPRALGGRLERAVVERFRAKGRP